ADPRRLLARADLLEDGRAAELLLGAPALLRRQRLLRKKRPPFGLQRTEWLSVDRLEVARAVVQPAQPLGAARVEQEAAEGSRQRVGAGARDRAEARADHVGQRRRPPVADDGGGLLMRGRAAVGIGVI